VQLDCCGQRNAKARKVKKGMKVLLEGNLDVSEHTEREGHDKTTLGIASDTY
jgi:single-stranded DNA-binding protein